MVIEVGNIIDGTVSGITKFGVFVDLGEKQTGLVHISEVAHGYIEDINTLLKVEDPVKVKVLSIDGNKIGLSIRQTQPKEGMDEEKTSSSCSIETKHRVFRSEDEIIFAR